MSTYQFTADDADIVLRASRCDSPREFRVHKAILSISSAVFKGMFNIPQPMPPTTPGGSTAPVIDVDDSPEDLEIFLRMVYPFDFPAMPTLDAISHALVMLDKYEVQGAPLQRLRSLLVSPEFLKNDPIGVYSIACGWKFGAEADLAAPYTSSLSVLHRVRPEDVQRMSGTDYHRILTLAEGRRSLCEGYIMTTPVACAGCFNYKNFYLVFRRTVLSNFKDDPLSFYDYGGCIIRCFEIALELERDSSTVLACGIRPTSHLGTFIRALAEKLSSNP